MFKWLSQAYRTISFWVMLAALICFGLAFLISAWNVAAPPYGKLLWLLLPALLYGMLTLAELRWKHGFTAAVIGFLLIIPVLTASVLFWFAVNITSQTTEDPWYYPRVYRFLQKQSVPGMEYIPSEIPKEAENVTFWYSDVVFAPGREKRFETFSLTCSGLDTASVCAYYEETAVRTDVDAGKYTYSLFEGEWKRNGIYEAKEVYCTVTVTEEDNTIRWLLRIEQ